MKRALAYLIERAQGALEMTVMAEGKFAAFNIMILHSILGTPLEPDLSGHVLMLEELNEYLYRIDRALFHIMASPNIRRVRGIKLGRISSVPENDKPFGASAEEMIKYWCAAPACRISGALISATTSTIASCRSEPGSARRAQPAWLRPTALPSRPAAVGLAALFGELALDVLEAAVNLALARRSASSGSTLSLRARLAITNRMSPISSAMCS